MKVFHVGIKAVIINDKKALILKELDIKGSGAEIYDLPGGRIEGEETIEETLKRELKEELGITNYSLGSLINACKHPYYKVNEVGLLLLFFKIYVKNFKLRLSSEHRSYQWISKKDLEKIIKNKGKIHKGIIKALEIALK